MRKDYHYNETEELFYQLEGSIKVIIQEDGIRKEMELNAAICICIQQKFHILLFVLRLYWPCY
jgi:mannose-6-phosphate isomerase-like protein (cupin superfamily)